MPTLSRLLSPPKGRAPAPWDTALMTDQTAPHRPASITREGDLLRRLSRAQWLSLALVGVIVLQGLERWSLTSQLEPQQILGVVEVAERGSIRDIQQVPLASYVVKEPTLMWVAGHWIRQVRTIGDSRVLLGRAWSDAQTWVAPELRPWFLEEIRKLNSVSLDGKKRDVSEPVVLPIAAGERTFKAEWVETLIGPGGDLLTKERWEATLVLRQAPNATAEERRTWSNKLGILIAEVHWHKL